MYPYKVMEQCNWDRIKLKQEYYAKEFMRYNSKQEEFNIDDTLLIRN